MLVCLTLVTILGVWGRKEEGRKGGKEKGKGRVRERGRERHGATIDTFFFLSLNQRLRALSTYVVTTQEPMGML